VGPERVRKVLSPFLTQDGCRGIVSTGYAGALKKEYKLGDILVPTEVQSVPPLREFRFQPDPALRERVVERVRTGPWRLHTDRMITSERVIVSSREKQGLGLTYDAGSVEMESAVIAELAEEASLPWIVVRVVLDEASFALPDVMQVLRWRRKKQYGKIIAHVATHPYQWVEAVRLLQRSRRASRALNRLFLERLLDGLVEMG
jgi:adenosylhomocysteine nucleosidase